MRRLDRRGDQDAEPRAGSATANTLANPGESGNPKNAGVAGNLGYPRNYGKPSNFSIHGEAGNPCNHENPRVLRKSGVPGNTDHGRAITARAHPVVPGFCSSSMKLGLVLIAAGTVRADRGESRSSSCRAVGQNEKRPDST